MKTKIAAYGAAFVLLATILLTPNMRANAASYYTNVFGAWIRNSIIDNTPIGSTTPASGSFTNITFTQVPGGGAVCHTANNTGDGAMYVECDKSDGTPSPLLAFSASGAANLAEIDLDATTVKWTGTAHGPLSGNVTGNLNGNVTGNVTGDVTGNVSGNAGTATALAATPGQCGSGAYVTGIKANGDAHCSGVSQYLVNYSLCTPGASTDAQCSGTVSFTGYADASYLIEDQVKEPDGANMLLTVTSKAASSFSYVLTCTYNCGVISSPTADVRLYHP